MSSSNYSFLQRFSITLTVGGSVFYALVVLWYVATFPDLGIRCLLPTDCALTNSVRVARFLGHGDDSAPYVLVPGDELIEINDRPVQTFLDFLATNGDLRSATILPGGRLKGGADPAELISRDVPSLVEIGDPESGSRHRKVKVRFLRPMSRTPDKPLMTYVAVRPRSTQDILLTIFWFLCQLAILLVAITGYWQRPTDPVVRTFCLMCSLALVAFVGGFHWWVIARNPLLNVPLIVCATVLPGATLHFFCMFPRRARFLKVHAVAGVAVIYVPLAVTGILIAFVYWAAAGLNGDPGSDGPTTLQTLAGTGRMLILGADGPFPAANLVTRLLYILRHLVYAGILLSCIYFFLTVGSLMVSLLRTQSVIERRQASGILVASLIATAPLIYTLYLAFYEKDDFALGSAQIPMFIASGLFMAAYAHGMLRHRLILADERLHRGRLYRLITVFVTVGFAGVVSVGIVTARSYSLPDTSSLVLRLALFLIVVVAVSFALWMRDRLQAAIDQRFFSEKYQLERALDQLNKAAGYLTDPSAMADMTLKTCRNVVDASTAGMYVREGSGAFRLIGAHNSPESPAVLPESVVTNIDPTDALIRRISAASRERMTGVQRLLHDLRAELMYLLRDEQGIAGMIVLGRRLSDTAYSAEDITFLQAIGQMTLLALHSSRANQNLARLTSELQAKVDHIAEQQRQLAVLRGELTSLQLHTAEDTSESPTGRFDRNGMRGNSRAIQEVLDTAAKAADSDATVLVRGESGTGKELLARVIQGNSRRADKPFVSVNCAALAPSLLESELFGHVRGAFTGAHSDKGGRFQTADGGTLFLDEIGDIPTETQVRLLRVLQERRFEPVGSDQSVTVDVRLIAATNRNLEEMIADGSFREDLYYRLNVVSVTLPPLRNHREDLIELVFTFLRSAVRKTGKRIRQITPEALAALESHHWPGNIRELENAVERAVVLADGDTIQVRDLPTDVRQSVPLVDERSAPDNRPLSLLPNGTPSGSIQKKVLLDFGINSDQSPELLQALAHAGGNKARAARLLNMPRSTFYSRLKKLGVDTADADPGNRTNFPLQ